MDVINIEVMLLGWSESHNGGAKVVLQLASPDDLEPFKRMTVAKGKVAGQRLALAIVEIGDDEKPVQTQPVGPLCRLAAQWCKDAEFQRWLWDAHDGTVDAVINAMPAAPAAEFGDATTTDVAARVVRMLCGVQSRRELDTNPNAGRSFHKLIREPYHHYLHEGEGHD